ncbi:hypothetical protein ACH5RR_007684, partial [Cinchona calisaya]
MSSSLHKIMRSSNPSKMLTNSLQIAIHELENVTSITRNLILESHNSQGDEALKDCEILFDESRSLLGKSLSLIMVDHGKSEVDLISKDIKAREKMKENMSNARDNMKSCQNGLRGIYYSYLDEVKMKIQVFRMYVDDCL